MIELAWRERDLQRAYLPFLKGQGLANYFTDPAFREGLSQPPSEDPQSAIVAREDDAVGRDGGMRMGVLVHSSLRGRAVRFRS